jgi:helix-turn-helix protein
MRAGVVEDERAWERGWVGVRKSFGERVGVRKALKGWV